VRKKCGGREKQLINSEQFDREFDLEAMLDAWKIDPKTQELLERLGSDYDKNGIPYWFIIKEEDKE
jgi:hypothetical protein